MDIYEEMAYNHPVPFYIIIRATNIPPRHTITSIYQKFLETGSVHDLSRAGRPPTITKDKVEEVKEILKMEPANSVRNVAQQANISKTQAHVIMRDIIWFKP
ncbi:unnamed protein product [Rotaria magnacalcarata]|uniref:Uncharacterized protein n=1 Tax=Rotaria magnacalcarata TaxID=392030 RepID=A0A816FQ92_9BILA|nr:unnamed protein product [Rotaria magnacalcarata]